LSQEWGPQYHVRANTIAFGHILTCLIAAKEDGAFATAADGSRVTLGIPKAQKEALGDKAFADIPLRRAGTATEAASAILAIASPMASYINGQTISVTGGRSI
jgi:3-oxoacyl-[acyl-carrier protein] reductase